MKTFNIEGVNGHIYCRVDKGYIVLEVSQTMLPSQSGLLTVEQWEKLKQFIDGNIEEIK